MAASATSSGETIFFMDEVAVESVFWEGIPSFLYVKNIIQLTITRPNIQLLNPYAELALITQMP
jgi:hypothetical protein